MIPAEFHFLRPAWLALLPLTAALAWWCMRPARDGGAWRGAIDPTLLAALLLPGLRAPSRLPRALLLAGWILAVLGLAGPAWERLPEPVQRRGDALLVALDLSVSMYATDVAPSRLERARFKLRDLLATRHEGFTALIAYAGGAHVVTPLSDDRHTVESMLPVLSPELMPAEGSDPVAAARVAADLLRGSGLPHGRLLLVADTLSEAQARQLGPLLAGHGLELSVLAVGTPEGAPVALPGGGFARDRNGSIVVPALDVDGMRAATQLVGGRFSLLTLDDSDLAALLPDSVTAYELRDGAQRTFDQWQDRASWLALALLPLAALALRRGWLLTLPLVLLVAPAPHAQAFEWQDLWLTRDQQGARALAAGEAGRAAQLFRAPGWRGAAAFEAGAFDAAAEAFAGEQSAAADYNRGNALARAGRLEEALGAYDEALAAAPGMQDARENRKLVEDLLRQQQQQQQQQGQPQTEPGQQSAPQQGQSSAGDGSPPTDASGSSDPSQGNAGDGASSPPPGDRGDRARDGDGTQQETAGAAQEKSGQEASAGTVDEQPGDATEDAARAQADAAESQALEQWLRQVPDRPGELLRRKFEYEYRQGRAGGGAPP